MNAHLKNRPEFNHQDLQAALDEVHRVLEVYTSERQQTTQPAQPEYKTDSKEPQSGTASKNVTGISDHQTAIDVLCEIFGLTPFERSILLLCAGMELDPRFAPSCAAAHDDPSRPWPTFGLALSALPEAHWNALPPAAPLRYWRLIEVGNSDSLITSPLRIDERILHYLAGTPAYPDERLQAYFEPIFVTDELLPSHAALAGKIVDLWSADNTRSNATLPPPAIHLYGDDPMTKRTIAVTACAQLGINLYHVRAHDIPAPVTEREALARLWQRESLLSNSALFIDAEDQDGKEHSHVMADFAEKIHGLLLIGSREPLHHHNIRGIRLQAEPPDRGEQLELWQTTLGPLGKKLNGEVEALVSQFNLDGAGIRAACNELQDMQPRINRDKPGQQLWDACRVQSRARLDDLAQRIETGTGWDDLVLPQAQMELLRTMAAHLRQRARVYEHWGFANKGNRGLGISTLFAGPSGTGKTLAAEVLANELTLDLYRIDLSAVVSKYIGETEKNLRRVFDAAEQSGAILLFDEADALFGKRSEVKDSHDRYANIEVSYLLQRIEAYRGLAVLTSNRKDDLDTAFLRRIRFIVQFPFPDTTQRAKIWRRIFPDQTPTDKLDEDKLSRLNITGGNIRNIALGAAFLAADADEPVRMTHLHRAAEHEYAKLEKSLTDAEVRGWE